MDEEDWKMIVEELTEQNKNISIERAVARKDMRKALKIIEDQRTKIEELQEQINARHVAAVEMPKRVEVTEDGAKEPVKVFNIPNGE